MGCCYPDGQLQEILADSKTELSWASENLQKAIIAGLDLHVDSLTVISAPALGSWPSAYKKMFFKGKSFSGENRDVDVSAGYLNLPLAVHFFKMRALQKELKKWAESLADEDRKNVIIYPMATSYVMAAVWLKKHFSNVNLTLIVPDLPQYMSENKNKLFLLLKSIDFKIMSKGLEDIDNFVLLSEKMKEKIPVLPKPYCVMEGIFSASQEEISAAKEEKTTVFYTGNLTRRSGVELLLESFSMLDDNYQLWVRGNGILKERIIEAGKTDSRIKYLPPLSRKEILEYQKRATVLINPVSPAEEFSNYFFPSKIMEYIASGTPVVMFKLGCIPEEYLPHVVIPEEVSAGAIAETFKEIRSWSSEKYKAHGEANTAFILNEKNPFVQTGKIVDLIRKSWENLCCEA